MKLNFELVPDGCWYSNLRSILSKTQWDYVRKDAISRSHGSCSVCGKNTKFLEAHEQWSYDEKKHIQKLENVIAVCKNCHSVIHIGRTSICGDIKKAEEHFMKVNNCSYSDYIRELGIANTIHKRRNLISDWKLDISWLKRFTENDN